MSRPLGELLVEQGLLTPARLETALVEQRQTKEYLGTLLVRKGWLSRQDLLPVLALQLGIRYMRLDPQAIDWSVAAKFSTTALTEHKCLAIAMDRHRVTVAVVNPLDMWGVSPDVVVDDEHLLRGFEERAGRLHVARENRVVLALQTHGRRAAGHGLECVVDLNQAAVRVVEERHPPGPGIHRHHATPRQFPFGSARTSTPFPLPGSRSIAARTACSASRLPSSMDSPAR